MIKLYLADVDISSYVSTRSLKIVEQVQNKANTCGFDIIVGGDQPIDNQEIKIFDAFEIISYSGTALVVKKKTLSDIDIITHYKLRANQEIWLGIGLSTEEKVTISSLVESGNNINITLESAAVSAHSAGEYAGEKIFGGVVQNVGISTNVLSENVAYSVQCIDFTKEFDRKEVNDSWENKNARQIIVGFVTEDLNNMNMIIDTMDYANDGAIQSAWGIINDAALPIINTNDIINGNGTSSGVFSWVYASGAADYRLTLSSTDYSSYVGVSSGQPTKGKMGLWIKFPSTNIITSIRLYCSSDAAITNMKGWYLTPIFPDGNWHFCEIDMSKTADFTAGTVDWTAIIRIALAIDQTASGIITIDNWRIYEDDFFTFFNLEAGATLDSFAAPFQRPTATIDALAKLNSYFWYIDYDRDIHFKSMDSDSAPWQLSDGSQLLFDMSESGWTLSNNDKWYITANKSQKTVTSATPTTITGTYNLSTREDGTTSPTSDRIMIHVYIENTVPTSIDLIFSTNSGVDYFSYSWTTNLKLGYNKLLIAKSAFTSTGLPDWGVIRKVDFQFTHSNNDPDVTIDSIWMLEASNKFYNGDNISVNIDTSQLKNAQTVAGGTEDSASTYSQVVQGDNAVREWILKNKFKNLVIKLDNNTSIDTCEGGTTTTNITATAHALITGDYIVNRTRSNAVRQITKVNDDNFTVEAVTSQTNGDTFSKFASTQTVGVENLVDETTVNYVSNFSEKSIRATDATTTLTTSDFLLFTYTEKIDIVTQYKDNTSITRMRLLLGHGDGQFDGAKIDDNSLDSRTAARDRARAEVDQYKNPVVTINFDTDFDGLKAGQLMTIKDSNKVMFEELLIQKVAKQYNQDYMKCKVTCATTLFGIIEYFQKLSTTISGAFVVDNAVIELVESEFPIITISESHTTGATEQVTSTETQTTTSSDETEKDKTNKYQPESASDIIDGLDVAGGWTAVNGTITTVTDEHIDTTASLSLNKTAVSAGTYMYINLASPVNLTDKFINYWFKVKDNSVKAKIKDLRIYFSSHATNPLLDYRVFLNLNDYLAVSELWRQIKFKLTDPDYIESGSFDITNIQTITLQYLTVNTTDTTASGDVLFDYMYTTDATKSQTVYGVGAYE